MFFCLLNTVCYSQKTKAVQQKSKEHSDTVQFIAKVDFTKMSKDGIHLNGYIVNIKYEDAKRLNGKTIRVTGIVHLVKAVRNISNQDIKQGRATDTKYIDHPNIEILQ